MRLFTRIRYCAGALPLNNMSWRSFVAILLCYVFLMYVTYAIAWMWPKMRCMVKTALCTEQDTLLLLMEVWYVPRVSPSLTMPQSTVLYKPLCVTCASISLGRNSEVGWLNCRKQTFGIWIAAAIQVLQIAPEISNNVLPLSAAGTACLHFASLTNRKVNCILALICISFIA